MYNFCTGILPYTMINTRYSNEFLMMGKEKGTTGPIVEPEITTDYQSASLTTTAPRTPRVKGFNFDGICEILSYRV